MIRLFPVTASVLEQWGQARAELAKIGQLEPNWDGYDAAAIGPMTLDNTRRALSVLESSGLPIPTPEISPTSAGTVSLAWENDNMEAYLEIGNTRYSGYIKIDQQPPALLEGQADTIDARMLWPIAMGSSSSIASAPAISHIEFEAVE